MIHLFQLAHLILQVFQSYSLLNDFGDVLRHLHGFQLGCAFLAAGALLVWNPLLLLVGQLLVFAGEKTKTKTRAKTKSHMYIISFFLYIQGSCSFAEWRGPNF